MASTFSPNLRLELIGTGEQQGTWGATTNVNLGTLIEEAIGGYTSVTVSNVGDTTLTTNNGSADQARNMVLNLTGTISAARNVIVPAIEKLYVVRNATTGGFAVTVKVSGQTGVSVPNGSTVFLYVDGTDVRAITGSAAQQNIGTSGATVPLLNGANTWSSSQTFNATNTFGTGSGATEIYMNGGASQGKSIFFRTAGSNRWIVQTTSVAETGGNVGSNFNIGRYDDAGGLIDSVLAINRSTGLTTLKELNLNTDLAVTHGGTGASDASGARTNLGLGSIATQNANSVAITGGAISGITDLAVADGGTGASTASDARTNLGLGSISTQNSNSVTITGGSVSGITDIEVADGGTGASTFTAYSVVAAGTTSTGAFQSVGTGTTGQVLTSNGSAALPTFQTLSIPVAFPSGTKLLFQQTSAPTGWTKDTTHNNKALRVVTGAAGSGGSVAFTDAFASQTVSGTTNSVAAGGTVGNTTLTISQIPSHTHALSPILYTNTDLTTTTAGYLVNTTTTKGRTGTEVSTTSNGSGGSHTHTFTGSSHDHTFTGTAINLAVQYVDVIIATKD